MEMMQVGYFFTNLFSEVFRVLQLEMPVFHIEIWRVWVGVFCITMSVKIFRRWLWDDAYESRRAFSSYPRKGE